MELVTQLHRKRPLDAGRPDGWDGRGRDNPGASDCAEDGAIRPTSRIHSTAAGKLVTMREKHSNELFVRHEVRAALEAPRATATTY
jgi:hypothetical protein